MTELKVLSWNIRHGLTDSGLVDLHPFIEVILNTDSDVVLLQEVDRLCSRSGKIDQHQEIKKALGYDWHGVWTTRTKLGWAGLYGISTFSRYPIYSSNAYLLSDMHSERCYAQESILDLDGIMTSVVNIHMPYDGHSGVAHTEMAWSTLCELEFSANTIIGGDLNALPSSAEIEYALYEYLDIGRSDTHVGGRIDYCVSKGDFHPRTQVVLPSVLSDHFPVLTTFVKTF